MMKRTVLHSIIISSFALSTNISIVLPSKAAGCGTNTANLRTNLGASPYPAATDAQAHHMIPSALLSEPSAIKICGYGIDLAQDARNGVFLPRQYCTNKAPKASPPYMHRGSHPGYTTYILGRIKSPTIKDLKSAEAFLNEVRTTLTTGVKADPAFPNELNGADPVAKSILC
jgi:hypothetical protein